jgi:polysaccharide biosynthesis transport protein
MNDDARSIIAPYSAVEVVRSRQAVKPQDRPPADRMRAFIAALRRRWLALAAMFIFVLAGAVWYTLRQPVSYIATASLLVNSRVLNLAERQDSVVPQASDEDRAIASEVQVLGSTEVARRVIDALGATRSPSLRERLAGNTNADAPAILAAVRQKTRIDRPGATNVLAVSFTATDPELAAKTANAYVDQYLAFKSDMRLNAARAADGSLRNELTKLRGQVEQAEASVAAYRRANNLLSADGVTLTEQEQSLYRQQDAAAQTALAEERARFNTARSQLARGSQGDDVGEALNSSVVGQLRGQRAIASAKLAELQARYKPGHPDVVKAQQEVRDIDQAISSEISRVVSNLEARVSVAQQKAAASGGIAARSRGELSANAAASVQLNELERRAEALRTNYAGLLKRQTAVASETVVADIDARRLSNALTPQNPSAPNYKLNLAIGTVLALIAALATVALLQLFDQTIVSSRDVETKLGLRHIVNIPAINSLGKKQNNGETPLDLVLDEQLSMLTESLRNLLLDLQSEGELVRTRIVGLTSARPGEGKSTLAACLARVAAASGRRTLLIDGDVRRPSIARLFGMSPSVGLTEVLSGQVTPDEALIRDSRSNASILPTLVRDFEPAQFSTETLRKLFSDLSRRFDLIIIDTAPALAAAEARQLLEFADDTLLVVRWNHTKVPVVRSVLKRLFAVGIRPIGVVTTRVDMRAIAAYAFDDVDHAYRSYARYGA